MAKQFYTDYVRHCLRYFTRYELDENADRIEKLNWVCCESALEDFKPKEQDILKYIYRERDTMGDNVYNASKVCGYDQEHLWALCRLLEQRVAELRHLI